MSEYAFCRGEESIGDINKLLSEIHGDCVPKYIENGGTDKIFCAKTLTGEIASVVCEVPLSLRITNNEKSTVVKMSQLGLVATDPKHRCKNLVKKLTSMVEKESDASVILIQGIPGYYRKLGYDYCAPIKWWAPFNCENEVFAKDEQFEVCVAKTESEFENFVAERNTKFVQFTSLCVDATAKRRKFLYDLAPGLKESAFAALSCLVKNTKTGKTAGVFSIEGNFGHINVSELWVDEKELTEEEQKAVVKKVLEFATQKKRETEFETAIAQPIQPHISKIVQEIAHISAYPANYGWYGKVINSIKFLESIKPILNDRLASSSKFATFTGELRVFCHETPLSFIITIENGTITKYSDFTPEQKEQADPWHIFWRFGMPSCTFEGETETLNTTILGMTIPSQALAMLLFGAHTVNTLVEMFPDMSCLNKMCVELVETLFPKIIDTADLSVAN